MYMNLIHTSSNLKYEKEKMKSLKISVQD